MRWKPLVAALAAAPLLGGCVSSFGETHYFKTVDTNTGRLANVFRLTVSGSAAMTNVRYVAGYYDERALDLFFNEVNSGQTNPSQGADKIFVVDCSAVSSAADCEALKAKRYAEVPFGGDATNDKRFLLVMSTNADAITNTIGNFAQNQVLVQSVVGLAERGRHDEASLISARAATDAADKGMMFDQLTKLSATTAVDPPAGVPTAQHADYRERSYVALLRVLAGGLNPSATPNFTTLEEARTWFAAQPRTVAK